MSNFTGLKDNLGSIYAMIMLARRPDNVRYVFMMGDRQDNIAEMARQQGDMRDPFADAPLERMWRERYCPARYDVEDLMRLPEATLGGAYARHMTGRGLRPDFYDDVAPRHKMHYLRLRIRQTHDIWHVLSGFGTDEFGEVGLQGFYFGQFTNGQSALIMAGALLKSILRGRFGDLEKFVEAFCAGYMNARRAKSLLDVRWEEMWKEPLDEVRRRYGIEVARI
jgi:ubiquinone biosynthesis protein Coq4